MIFYICLIIIIFIVIFINYQENFENNVDMIVNHLEFDELSSERFDKLKESFKKYSFPEPKINRALHYERDKTYIEENYPMINKNSIHFKQRPGAYGLTASFIKFLHDNKHKDYVFWYEDDAIPYSSYEEIKKVLDIRPIKGNDIYYLGYMNYLCEKECENIGKWIPKKYQWGAHAILFTKGAINAILNYINRNRIDLPIDILLVELSDKKIINGHDWLGSSPNNNKKFCGFFEQYKTFCNKRESIIDNSIKKN